MIIVIIASPGEAGCVAVLEPWSGTSGTAAGSYALTEVAPTVYESPNITGLTGEWRVVACGTAQVGGRAITGGDLFQVGASGGAGWVYVNSSGTLVSVVPNNSAAYSGYAVIATGDSSGRMAFGLDNGRPFLGAGPGSSARDTFWNRASSGVWNAGTTESNALGSLNLANLTASGDIVLTGASRTIVIGNSQPFNWIANYLGAASVDVSGNSLVTIRTANSERIRFEAAGITAAVGFNFAPRTKTALLATSANATAGWWRITDSTPNLHRVARPDGTNWRWIDDESIVT